MGGPTTVQAMRDPIPGPAVAKGGSPAWHTLPIESVAREIQTDPARGLTNAEAGSRLKRYGRNQLEQTPGRTVFAVLVAQFKSLIVLLLVAATGVAFAMGETMESAAILVVIVLNATIGFLTEWKAERTLTALHKQTVRVAHVMRDGAESQIPAAELVPGDLIILEAGARVPADGRIIESVQLQIEEAALTGESEAVTKATDPIALKEAPLGDRR